MLAPHHPPDTPACSTTAATPGRHPTQVFVNNVNATLHELLATVDSALQDFHVLVPQDKLKLLVDRVEVRGCRWPITACC
jgi:hypothetical protein